MNSALMNIEQAAEYLQVSRETLYKYVRSSRVPAMKIGRHWRFSQTELSTWVHDRSAQTPVSAAPAVSAGPLRVLVVDDDAAVRRLIGAWIGQMGEQVSMAASGAQAIEMLRQGRYDLVMLDLYLSDMTGVDVLNQMGDQGSLQVVLITGMPESEAMGMALGHPVAYALTKPFRRADVEAVVRMIRTARGGFRPDRLTNAIGGVGSREALADEPAARSPSL